MIWRKDYVKDYGAQLPAWGITGAPLVDGDRLIVLVGGQPDAKVIALRQDDGQGDLAGALVGLPSPATPSR